MKSSIVFAVVVLLMQTTNLSADTRTEPKSSDTSLHGSGPRAEKQNNALDIRLAGNDVCEATESWSDLWE